MASDTISILDGTTFVVSDRRGDIDAAPDQPHGLFFRDTRFLSRWQLRVNGGPVDLLSVDDSEYFSAQFFLAPPTGTIYRNPYLSVIRQRSVGDGLHEDLIVANHAGEPATVELVLDVDADFADLFEVKDAQPKKGVTTKSVSGGALVLRYEREGFVRRTTVTPSAEAIVDERGLTFRLELAPHSEWQTCIEVVPDDGTEVRDKHRHGSRYRPVPNMRQSLEDWVAHAPRLDTDWDPLVHLYERSLVDLAALRFFVDADQTRSVPAAGLPWFMALFGRDSLLTSYQALPFAPDLAVTTLRVLASLQGSTVDGFRDEEPGKILHELRVGELTSFGERPHGPSFGSVDATPLFLVVLEETYRWAGDAALVRELEPNARAALDWIDRHGDRDGDGYVEYQTANPAFGLENMCWKDSGNSILFADGRPSRLPRATCEVQGYVYDAKVRSARLAREVWGDPALADRLDTEAAALRDRFNRDFWLADRGGFALALDGAKSQVDSLTSNMGHLLWSGIVEPGKAEAVARHLTGPDLASGWGIRTMARGEGGYNPIEYHNGTVWPHDTALCAAGLARYGYRAEAGGLAQALFEAAGFFGWRLPEVFAGYDRAATGVPVEYPTASSPQAWATGTPLLLLRVILGLEPDGRGGRRTDPALPPAIGRLELL
jgi:glycogen debranching enzyme